MSTIASPRRLLSGTPNSSARPSLEISRSAVTSPVPGSSNNSNGGFFAAAAAAAASSPSAQPLSSTSSGKRSNRVALREYYNLQRMLPRIEVPDSEVPLSDFDRPDFDADEFARTAVAQSGLEELLRLYTKVLGEVRALDAEKKALVYDNYNKLIDATDTIRKVSGFLEWGGGGGGGVKCVRI